MRLARIQYRASTRFIKCVTLFFIPYYPLTLMVGACNLIPGQQRFASTKRQESGLSGISTLNGNYVP